MSGFDANWLALREPADRLARDAGLVSALADHLNARGEGPSLLDIGCGTGSTYRTLAPALPFATRWRLLDYDPLLLAEAERQIGAKDRVQYQCHDLTDIDGLPLEGVDVLTASALFDLCSESFCDRLIARLAERRIALYAALNYDGVIAWTPTHPLDEPVIGDFNRHQRTDKGFGPSLGPQATAMLRDRLEAAGYRVSVARSPWRMGPGEAELQTAFLDGFEKPLTEIDNLSSKEIAEWLAFRRKAVSLSGSSCMVGHLDLLALPG